VGVHFKQSRWPGCTSSYILMRGRPPKKQYKAQHWL